MSAPSWLRRLGRDRRGATAVLFALSMPILAGGMALAVDVGALFLERRELQAASDAAALAAATRSNDAVEVARAILSENGFAHAAFELKRGRYREDPTIDRARRFVPDPAGPDVRIEASAPARAYFANHFAGALFEAKVVSDARLTATLSFSVGSRLASLRDGVLNDALGRLLGTKVSLSLADYRSLAGVGISGNGLLNALLGTELVGRTLGEVLDRRVSARVLVDALARGLAAEGDHVGAGIVRRALTSPTKVAADLSLRDLVSFPPNLETIEVAHLSRALSAELNVLSLLQGSVARNGATSGINLGLGLDGLAGLNVEALVGEGLRGGKTMAVGWVGTRVETGQVRLQASLQALGGLDLGGQGQTLKLPLEAVIAGGSATVVAASCSANPADRSVTLEVQPGLARLEIGDITKKPVREIALGDSLPPAAIVNVPSILFVIPSVKIFVRARALSQEETPRRLTFRGQEIGSGRFQTVVSAKPLSTTVTNLFRDLDIRVELGGLGLDLGLLSRTVSTLLMPLAVPVVGLLDNVLTVAGLGLGEMDVRVESMTCDTARLVG